METEAFFEKIERIKMPIRILIFAGTIAIFVGLFVGLIYLPKRDAIAKTQDEISSLEKRLSKAKVRSKNLEKFEAEKKKADAEFKEALKLLPEKKEIPSLLRNITQLGRDSNLEFRLFRPKKEKKEDFYVEIPVSVVVRGTYHNVALFFDRVGKMDRIVNILDVSMKPERSLSTDLITRCNAITFRFEAEEEAKDKKSKNKKGKSKKK
jgi:type IV pilus assembly protein PilO